MHEAPQAQATHATGEKPVSVISQACPSAGHGTALMPDVGEVLRRLDASRALTGSELEQHITDCSVLWQRAYARFQQYGNPADRDEALLWLHEQTYSILMRPGMEEFLAAHDEEQF